MLCMYTYANFCVLFYLVSALQWLVYELIFHKQLRRCVLPNTLFICTLCVLFFWSWFWQQRWRWCANSFTHSHSFGLCSLDRPSYFVRVCAYDNCGVYLLFIFGNFLNFFTELAFSLESFFVIAIATLTTLWHIDKRTSLLRPKTKFQFEYSIAVVRFCLCYFPMRWRSFF